MALRTELLGVVDLDAVSEGFQAILDGMVPPLAPECRAYTFGGRVVFAADVQRVADRRCPYHGDGRLCGGWQSRVPGRASNLDGRAWDGSWKDGLPAAASGALARTWACSR